MTWRRKWQPTPVLLPGESCGQRSLVSYGPWSCKESDTTEVTWHACTRALQWPSLTSVSKKRNTTFDYENHCLFSKMQSLNRGIWKHRKLLTGAGETESQDSFSFCCGFSTTYWPDGKPSLCSKLQYWGTHSSFCIWQWRALSVEFIALASRCTFHFFCSSGKYSLTFVSVDRARCPSSAIKYSFNQQRPHYALLTHGMRPDWLYFTDTNGISLELFAQWLVSESYSCVVVAKQQDYNPFISKRKIQVIIWWKYSPRLKDTCHLPAIYHSFSS